MGQYYKPINIEKNEHLYSHNYDNGLKLMEHSWIKNNFVQTVESLITKDGAWSGCSLVWAGDYADNEEGKEQNLYMIADEKDPINPIESDINYRYLINHSKRLFIDKNKGVKDNDGWTIHPLPLMTCEGNGRGGGDFRGDSELIGTWARDQVEASNKAPKEYKEIIFNVTE